MNRTVQRQGRCRARQLVFLPLLLGLCAGCVSPEAKTAPGAPESRPAVQPAAQSGAQSGPRPGAGYTDFGESMSPGDHPTVQVAAVLASPKDFDGKPVRVQGEIVSVCARKGCWIRMAPRGSEQNVFVKFTCPVQGRLIPMEAVGHQALVEGVVTIETVSEEDARHYAEEGGQSAAEVARIIGPQTNIRIQAPAARVIGLMAH